MKFIKTFELFESTSIDNVLFNQIYSDIEEYLKYCIDNGITDDRSISFRYKYKPKFNYFNFTIEPYSDVEELTLQNQYALTYLIPEGLTNINSCTGFNKISKYFSQSDISKINNYIINRNSITDLMSELRINKHNIEMSNELRTNINKTYNIYKSNYCTVKVENKSLSYDLNVVIKIKDLSTDIDGSCIVNIISENLANVTINLNSLYTNGLTFQLQDTIKHEVTHIFQEFNNFSFLQKSIKQTKSNIADYTNLKTEHEAFLIPIVHFILLKDFKSAYNSMKDNRLKNMYNFTYKDFVNKCLSINIEPKTIREFVEYFKTEFEKTFVKEDLKVYKNILIMLNLTNYFKNKIRQ